MGLARFLGGGGCLLGIVSSLGWLGCGHFRFGCRGRRRIAGLLLYFYGLLLDWGSLGLLGYFLLGSVSLLLRCISLLLRSISLLLRSVSLLLRCISLSQCGSVSLLLRRISLGSGLAVPGFLFAAGLFLALGPFGLLCLFAECLFDFLNHGRSIDEGGLHGDTLGLLVEDGFYEEGVATETGEGIARSTLLAFLLGVTAALACGESFEQDGAIEERTVVLLVKGFFVLEIHLHAVLLRPLEEFTLEVDLLVGHVFDVEQAAHDFVLNEPLASLVAAVEIDSADEGLEGIATDIAIVAAALGGHLEQPL